MKKNSVLSCLWIWTCTSTQPPSSHDPGEHRPSPWSIQHCDHEALHRCKSVPIFSQSHRRIFVYCNRRIVWRLCMCWYCDISWWYLFAFWTMWGQLLCRTVRDRHGSGTPVEPWTVSSFRFFLEWHYSRTSSVFITTSKSTSFKHLRIFAPGLTDYHRVIDLRDLSQDPQTTAIRNVGRT